jgi:hypothetical protein
MEAPNLLAGLYSAAERRKNLATAEGRGLMLCPSMSRVAAKESFAATRLIRFAICSHGLQPWLSSYAAPRLGRGML